VTATIDHDESASEPPGGRRKIEWFADRDGVDLYESGIMSPAVMNPQVIEQVDLSALGGGARSRVLFQGAGPDGFSLVHVWFGEDFPLPRHTHSADCLYYVLRGELRMGAKVLRAGDGMFIPADRPYTYRAGPGGVEVLEFRASTSFDMKTLDQDVAKWQTFVAGAAKVREAWEQTRPAVPET
jgi:hypothetical protein